MFVVELGEGVYLKLWGTRDGWNALNLETARIFYDKKEALTMATICQQERISEDPKVVEVEIKIKE